MHKARRWRGGRRGGNSGAARVVEASHVLAVLMRLALSFGQVLRQGLVHGRWKKQKKNGRGAEKGALGKEIVHGLL